MAKKKVGVRLATNEIVALIIYALWIHTIFWQTVNGVYNTVIFSDIITIMFVLIPATVIAFITTLLSQIISKKYYPLSLWLYTSLTLVLIYTFKVSPSILGNNRSLPICLLIIAFLAYFALKPLFKKDK